MTVANVFNWNWAQQESELRQSNELSTTGLTCPSGARSDSADNSSRGSSPISLSEDRMEPIAEENSPKSFERSFSFVSIIEFFDKMRSIHFIGVSLLFLFRLILSRKRKTPNCEIDDRLAYSQYVLTFRD